MQLLAVAAAATAYAPATIREFRVDAGHSDVAFSIGFLGHSVRGWFDDIRGTIVYSPKDLSASAITVVIGVKSIATGSAHRDEHLRSPDFFDATRFPSIVFRSSSIERRGPSFVANGVLSMHGVQRAVSIPFRESSPPVADPHGSTLVFFSGALRIARKDYGILGGSKFNDWFDELRSATMADSVDITLDVTGWDTDIDRTGDRARVRDCRNGGFVKGTHRACPWDRLARYAGPGARATPPNVSRRRAPQLTWCRSPISEPLTLTPDP
jgi:polyisoprenoid-binding protein YceI